MCVIRFKIIGVLVGTSALLAVGAVQAQERAAASALETQMTWSTLAKMVESANANSAAANARIDQVSKCNLKYKLYAPEGKKKGLSVDGDGCIFNQPVLDLADRVKKTEDDIIATNKKLSDLETFTKGEIGRIDGKMADLAKTVAQLDTRVGKVEDGLERLTTRVKTVEDQIKVVNTKIAGLTDRVDVQDAKIATLQKDMDAVEKRMATAETTIKTHTTQIKDINADIVQINKDITALEKDVLSLDSRVTDTELSVTRITNCNKQGKFYSGSGSTCKNVTVPEPAAPKCSLDLDVRNYGGACKAGYSDLGTFVVTPAYSHANEGKSSTYRNCLKVVCQ